jgi:hypothetical protein
LPLRDDKYSSEGEIVQIITAPSIAKSGDGFFVAMKTNKFLPERLAFRTTTTLHAILTNNDQK